MLGPAHKQINRIADLAYVDADTGRVIERFQMREIYDYWDPYKKDPQMVRWYRLDREKELNPGFKE